MLEKPDSKIWSFFNAIFSSTAFLSRLPLYQDGDEVEQPDFSKTAYAFPLAGMLIALPTLILLLLCYVVSLPPMITAILVVGAQIAVTGALHEDGLADVADGFWGGHTREQKLKIMRDSAIGSYGTLALIISVGLRVALLAAILPKCTPLQAAAIVVAISALSRTAVLWPWVELGPSRSSTGDAKARNGKDEAGLSARHGMPDRANLLLAIICAAPATALLVAAQSAVATAGAIGIGATLTAFVMLTANRHIGGHTGDVLGATQQMSEIGLLLGLVMLI